MPSRHARIATADGSRLIKRLLTHWGHKFDVSFDERSGHVPFDAQTTATFAASDDTLLARIDSTDDAQLVRFQDVVANHLHRMARGETLQIDWQDGDG